jgi:hypothetical protein
MAPANAAVITNGDGMTLTVVKAQLINKLAVNVNFALTCTTANHVAADGGMEENPPDTYFVYACFTLSEYVRGTVVSYQRVTTPDSGGSFPR